MTNKEFQTSDQRNQLTEYETRVLDFIHAYRDGKELTPEQLRTKERIDHNNLVSQTSKLIAEVRKRFGF